MRETIEPLTAADIPSAQGLVELAGWNQLPTDWLRIIQREPNGCFKATLDGQLVGTVTTICYDTALAWIGMMLVHPAVRRQGIGKRLMQAAIDLLHSRGIEFIGLDATPAGRPLYEQLGFAVADQWQRWQRPLGPSPAAGVNGITDQTLGSLDARYRELDTAAFGVDRWSWIEALAEVARPAYTPDGYALLRPGRFAAYLGPLVATERAQAEQLAQTALGNSLDDSLGACLWDVPPGNPIATCLAQRFGFQPVRTLYRMWLNQPGPSGRASEVYAISDPATG